MKSRPPLRLPSFCAFIGFSASYVAYLVVTLSFFWLVPAALGKPWLINAQQSDFRSRPSYIRDHFAHIESLPFDGLTITTTAGRRLMSGASLSLEQISQEFAPLSGLVFQRVTQNFAVVNVDRPGDFFHDWSTTVENFRRFARVLKQRSITGIFFDNEEYQRPLFNYPDDTAFPSKSLAEYQAQARLRGREIMRAITDEYPEIVVMVLHGPYSSFPGTPEAIRAGQTDWESEELRGAFSIGLIEGMDSQTQFVDGGEIYAYRTSEEFDASYRFRKQTLAAAETAWPLVSSALRPLWPSRVGIAFGVSDEPFPEGTEMNAAILQTALEGALQHCDDYVWLHFERGNWNAPGEVDPQWWKAVAGARERVFPAGRQVSPGCDIISPTLDSVYYSPGLIPIVAEAKTTGAAVVKVEFFAGSMKLGETTAQPHSLPWPLPPAGVHTLTSKVTDSLGRSFTSSPITISTVSSFAAGISFQSATVTPPLGYFVDTGAVYAARGNGLTYGWNTSQVNNMRLRDDVSNDLLRATLCQMGAQSKWEMAVPNGTYQVAISIGDGAYPSTYTLVVEGVPYWEKRTLEAGEFSKMTKAITVLDGKLTISPGDAANEATRINYVIVASVPSAPVKPHALTATVATPTTVDLRWADDSSNETAYELQRSPTSSFSNSVRTLTLSADATSYWDNETVAGAQYYYRVAARNDAGRSGFSNIVAVEIPHSDGDGDRIPDLEEFAPLSAGIDDRLIDTDSDGFSNAEEAIAGTDPQNRQSRIGISSIVVTETESAGTACTVSFPTAVNRKYFVECSNSLVDGLWSLLPGSHRVGTGETESVADTTGARTRFYRLRVSR